MSKGARGSQRTLNRVYAAASDVSFFFLIKKHKETVQFQLTQSRNVPLSPLSFLIYLRESRKNDRSVFMITIITSRKTFSFFPSQDVSSCERGPAIQPIRLAAFFFVVPLIFDFKIMNLFYFMSGF